LGLPRELGELMVVHSARQADVRDQQIYRADLCEQLEGGASAVGLQRLMLHIFEYYCEQRLADHVCAAGHGCPQALSLLATTV